jgi:hypothetical protein
MTVDVQNVGEIEKGLADTPKTKRVFDYSNESELSRMSQLKFQVDSPN